MRKPALLAMMAACVGTLAPGAEVKVKKAQPVAMVPATKENPDDLKIKKLLEKPVSFDFVETPLADVLGFLRTLLRVNLVVAPDVNTRATVTLRVKEMKAGWALGWVLELCDAKMEIKDGAIFVSAGRRKRPARPVGGKDPETLRIKKQLAKRISFDFVETPLADVLAFISTLVDVAIVVAPDVRQDATVTLKVDEMKLGSALKWIVKLVGTKMEIRNGAIFVWNPRAKAIKKKARPGGGHL